ncbi:MAG: hypothetical protein HC819_01665 [Cyclobacteriaceae bacterium]|nr:hypothetical protein [Cyclobacteriaceae bacterium]
MKMKLMLAATILLMVPMLVVAQPSSDRFEIEISAFEQLDDSISYTDNAILFVGSSSIRMWRTLAEDMAPMPVINRGFGGSTIPEVTKYADRIISVHQPEMLVLYAGENDLANDTATAEDALGHFKDFYSYMNKNLPETSVFFLSIKPSVARKKFWPKMHKANTKIRRFIDKKPNFYFVDVASPMLDDEGNALKDIFIEDQLHMNAKGYSLWTATLKPVLRKHYED